MCGGTCYMTTIGHFYFYFYSFYFFVFSNRKKSLLKIDEVRGKKGAGSQFLTAHIQCALRTSVFRHQQHEGHDLYSKQAYCVI